MSENITIDVIEYQKVLKRLLRDGFSEDLYVTAARIVLKDPDYIVTPELRQQLKMLGYGTMYGIGPQSFIKSLKYTSKLQGK